MCEAAMKTPCHGRSTKVQCNTFGLVEKCVPIDCQNIPSEKQNNDYILAPKDDRSEIIVIQHSTESLKDVEELLPWRSVLVVESRRELHLTSSLPFYRKNFFNKNTGEMMPAILIVGADMKPNSVIDINGKRIPIRGENHTRQYIISLNQWVNIQDKSFTRESGVFSMFSDNYKEIFDTYTQQVPFSQTVLLQMVPLGTKLNADTSITSSDRSQNSNFIDYVFAGQSFAAQRKCNGGKFAGNHPGVYAFKGEEHQTVAQDMINRLLADIHFDQYGNGRKSKANTRVRTLTSQHSEYCDKIGDTGCFAINPFGAWVTTKPSHLTSRVDNELPHELGHTYGLPDWTGKDQYEYKRKDFQLARDNTLVLPFFKDLKCKRGSMNGAVGSETDVYFTSLSAFDKKVAVKKMLESSDIDPKVVIDPDGNLETVLIILNYRDVLAYKINVLIPSVLCNNSPFSADNDFVSVKSFDGIGKLLREIRYNVHRKDHRIVALPQGFLSKDGYLQVLRPHQMLSRRFFERYSSFVLDPPRLGNRKDVFSSFSEKHLKTRQDHSILTNEEKFANLFKTYDSLVITSSSTDFLPKMKIPILSNEDIGKTLTILNKAAQSVAVYFENNETVTLPPQKGFFMEFRNGWRERHTEDSRLTRIADLSAMAELTKDAASMQQLYSPKFESLQVTTRDGFWQPCFKLHSLSAKFLNKTIMFQCRSTWAFDIAISKEERVKLSTGQCKNFQFTNGWQFALFDLGLQATNGNCGCEFAGVEGIDGKKKLAELFQVYSEVKAQVNQSRRNEFNLPDMDREFVGRKFIVNKNMNAHITVKADDKTFTTVSNAKYVFSFFNPWQIILRNCDRPPPASGKNICINSQKELSKFENYKYVYELLQHSDTIDVRTFDGCWIPTLHFHAAGGYYKHMRKMVMITVNSTWPVTLDLQSSSEKLCKGSKIVLELGAGWEMTSKIFN